MFIPTGISDTIFRQRYSFDEKETWQDACLRVAKQMALAESPEKQKLYENKFFEVLSENHFVPGGRIWYNSGRINPQLLNCFVLGNNLDSKEGWGQIAKEMIITSMTGGGCGIDFSDVRPRGSSISGQKGVAPGPVELMKLIDNCAEPIRAGGQRRVALMFSLDLDHPDVLEFLDAKLTKGMLTHANVSVRSKNTTKFIKAVKEDGDWQLSWKGQSKKTIRAKDLWNKIVKNAYNSAEPGVLNWELVENESNISYIEPLVSTNPCVSGDTPILTRNGYKRIDSLVGIKTDIWNGFEWSEVEPTITGKNQQMVLVSLSNGRTLNCTEYHKFVIAKDYNSNTEEVKAKDLQPGMKLIKHDFPIIENGIEIPEAYLQGFYSAEGCAGQKLIQVYEPKIECLENRLRGFGGKVTPDLKHKRTNFYFKPDLKEKSYVPFEGNLKSRLDWLSGLLDGDGTELKEGGCQLWSIDRDFLLNVQLLLNTLGVSSKILIGKPEQYKDMPGGNYLCKESFRICIGAAAMQNLKKLGLSCIRLKFLKNPNRDASQFVTIVDVTENGISDTVYCFNEPKRHTGIFNGVLTAQCGEIALSSYDCCCLGHLVLPRFVHNSGINWSSLADTIRTSTRFLDNVLSVNSFPLGEMREKSQKLRRIGLGTTGLADCLALLNLRYGSKEANDFIEKLYRFISKVAYEASVMIAIEKGPFPACDREKHVQSDFMKRMPNKIKSLVKEHGIRNCAILTQAPTGTVSILSGNCSSGIEPMFAPAYERRFWTGDKRQTELVFHPLFEQFMKEKKDVSHFVASYQLSVEEHMEVQSIIQKHVDNAVSKTINMGNDYPIEDMEKAWLEYLPKLKGTTFYREGTRGFENKETGQTEEPPLKALDFQEAIKRFTETHQIGTQQIDDCVSGICSI